MSRMEDSSTSSNTNYGKKKRRTKKDLSMMELIEQVNSHKSRVLDNVSDPGRHLPKQRSQPTSSTEDYWMKQYSDSDDDSDGAKSEIVQVERPARPSTARGRRRVSVDVSAPSSTGSERGSTDSPRLEEDLMTPNRSSGRSGNNSNPPRSKSRLSNTRPLKYKRDKVVQKDATTDDLDDKDTTPTQGQKGRSRNLPPLSRELSSTDASLRQRPTRPVSRLGRERSVLNSIGKDSPQGSPRALRTSGDIFTLERQRTMVLDNS